MEDREPVGALDVGSDVEPDCTAKSRRWGGQHDRVVRTGLQRLVDRPHQPIVGHLPSGVDADLAEPALDLLEVGLGVISCFGQRHRTVRPVSEWHEQVEHRGHIIRGQSLEP